jgi:hypothetical protein
MLDLKKQTQYAFFKQNSKPTDMDNCGLPIKNSSYQYKYDVKRGNLLCNMYNIMKK